MGTCFAFVDILFILFSSMIIILKFAFIWLFMLKFGNPLSKNFFLFDGLHPWRLMHYFIHMIAYRAVLAIIVLLTDTVNLKLRVLILLVLQMLSLFFHMKRLYSNWLLFFQILAFWELNLAADVIIMTVSAFKDSQSPLLGIVTGGINIGLVVLFVITILLASIYKCKRINKCLKPKLSKLNPCLDAIEKTIDCNFTKPAPPVEAPQDPE